MKMFMLLIRNEIDYQADWSPEKHEQFIRDCQAYAMKLKQNGRLISSHPLAMDGTIISRSNNEWNVRPMRPKGEVQVGYFHILAEDMDEAIELAKGSPEFGYGPRARIEVRAVRMSESDAGAIRTE